MAVMSPDAFDDALPRACDKRNFIRVYFSIFYDFTYFHNRGLGCLPPVLPPRCHVASCCLEGFQVLFPSRNWLKYKLCE